LGIVYSLHYDCEGETECVIYLDGISQFYNELKPEAKIVVYSVEHYERQVLYGSVFIQFDGFGANKVNRKLTIKNVISLN
jgi:hypothetical protein